MTTVSENLRVKRSPTKPIGMRENPRRMRIGVQDGPI